jgi:uncharacterized Zn-binding protein involved in type VI secretion
MADPFYHVGATGQCQHSSGLITVVSTNQRVKVSGQPVATMGDTFTVAGCLFTVGSKAQPCTTVQFLTAATRVKVLGQAAILKTSTGVCKSAEQAPQGKPSITVTQTRAKGT